MGHVERAAIPDSTGRYGQLDRLTVETVDGWMRERRLAG